MQEKIKFSIVMPIYNGAKYLENSISNVLTQTYKEFQLILVDDGSSDESLSICRQYAKEHDCIQVIKHSENLGLSESRNSGIKVADGDYILFWDCDDEYDNCALEKICSYAKKHHPEIIIYSLVEDYYDKDMNLTSTFEKSLPTCILLEPKEIHSKVVDLERETMLGYAWNKAYSLDYLRKHNFKFKNITHIEDILFNISYIENVSSMVIMQDVLYYYVNVPSPRLTSKYLEDYMQLQIRRVVEFLAQQERWGSLDDAGLSLMSSVYIRSLVSSVERDVTAGISKEDSCTKLKGYFDSDLYQKLCPYFSGSSKLKLAYKPFLEANVSLSYKRAKLISKIKAAMPGLFAKLKQNR